VSLDPLLLSRVQWVWVISWHILLPAFTVGLASYIAVLEGLAFFLEPSFLGVLLFGRKLVPPPDPLQTRRRRT
jgi:cytochrome bd-type quinol oxidase subunit 1